MKKENSNNIVQTRESAVVPSMVPRIYGDVPPFMAVPHAPALEGAEADIVVIGMPYDGKATFRGGATRRAPQEIRKYSLLFGNYHFDWDLHALDYAKVIDCGDVDIMPGNTPESYARLEGRIDQIHAIGAIPLMIGGDHGVTYPAVRAVARHRGSPMGVIVFDTHLDLSDSANADRLTHSTPVRRICELPEVNSRQIAIIGARGPRNRSIWTPLSRELGIRVFPDAEIQARGIEEVVREARAIASPDGRPPYISVDIDVVDPAFAPGTNSPEPGGLSSREIIIGIRRAAEQGFAGFDVVEVSPDFDTASGTTSILAARLFVEVICCFAAERAGTQGSWEYRP